MNTEKTKQEKEENSKTIQFIKSPMFEEELGDNETELKKYDRVLLSYLQSLRTRRKLLLLLNPLIFILFVLVIEYIDQGVINFKELLTKNNTIITFCVMILVELLIFIIDMYRIDLYENKRSVITRQIRTNRRRNIKPSEKKEKDFFEKIIEINNENINDYYQQVRKNVNKLLYVAISFGVIGFAFIFCALLFGAIYNKNMSLVYLSTVTGIIIDSFAGSFFIQYGKSILNMQFYFEGLLRTQDKIIDIKGTSQKAEIKHDDDSQISMNN